MTLMRRVIFVLRRLKWLLTPPQLPRMGQNCKIHPMARFEGHPHNITFGNNVSIGAYALLYCHKDGHIHIGDGSHVGDGAIIHTGKRKGFVTIGRDCTVQNYTAVFGHGGTKIGDFVRIGSHNVIISANHVFKDPDRPIYKQGLTKEGIEIGNDVWFGAGGTVLDGVHIGDGSVVAARALVNRPVKPMSIVGGVPARQIGMRREPLEQSDQVPEQ